MIPGRDHNQHVLQMRLARSSDMAGRRSTGFLLAGLSQAGLEDRTAAEDRGLVGDLALELVPQGQVVIDQQPQPPIGSLAISVSDPSDEPGRRSHSSRSAERSAHA